MSDQSIVALIAVIVSGAVGLASLGFNFWSSGNERRGRANERREDNREWYKRTLFEKRVQAAQEAHAWLMRLYRARNSTMSDQQWKQRLSQLCSDARQWYQDNALFLHGSLPRTSEFVGAISWLESFAAGDERASGEVDQALLRAEKEVRDRLQEVHRKLSPNDDGDD